jgi:NitT/TauT family transport system substrate-binding protein
MNKKLALLLVVLMLVAVVAGCGKSEPAKPAQPAAKAEPIIIAYTPWNGYGALFVAAQKGMFKSKGIDVQIQSIEDVGVRKQSIVAKKIQGMAASVDVSIAALGQGVPIKMVWAFDASAGADGILVTKASGIKTIADLKGKEVAFNKGSASHLYLSTLLKKNGMKDGDVKAVEMKASEAASALMAGKVPAAVTWEPHITKAAAAGNIILSTTKDTPALIADVLVLHEDFVKANPDAVQKIVAALSEATDFIQKNPTEAAKIMAVELKEKPEETLAGNKTIQFYNLKDNLALFGTPEKPGALQDVAKIAGEFYVGQKILTKVPDTTKVFDSTFINKIK